MFISLISTITLNAFKSTQVTVKSSSRIIPFHTSLVLVAFIAIKQAYGKLTALSNTIVTPLCPTAKLNKVGNYCNATRAFYERYIALCETLENLKVNDQQREIESYKLEHAIKDLYNKSCKNPLHNFVHHIKYTIIIKLKSYTKTLCIYKDNKKACNIYQDLELLMDKLLLVTNTVIALPSYHKEDKDKQ